MNAIRRSHRNGKVLILVVLMLPALFAVMLLVYDGSRLSSESRSLQHMADVAAYAAADELSRGESNNTAIAAAQDSMAANDDQGNVSVEVNIPPTTGEFAGSSRHAEVIATRSLKHYFGGMFDYAQQTPITTRAVAGLQPATVDAAIVVLDEDPSQLNVLPILPIIPTMPTMIGGMEVNGLGTVTVEGAVLVNTKWGGQDADGMQAGDSPGPPYGIACMPPLGFSKLRASDIRVAGGVDHRNNYQDLDGNFLSELKANARPVPDPLRNVPPPTVSADPANVVDVHYGGRTIIGLPFIGPPIVLNPGIYEWIDVATGNVTFNPGVYVIRGKNPVTQLSLTVLAAKVKANGVMFYITNNNSYSVYSPGIDAADAEAHPGSLSYSNMMPSAVVNVGVLGSSYSPLSSSGSPYDGMMIFQSRHDRRPIVLVQELLLGSGTIRGTVYNKWGQLQLAGHGTYDMRIVTGTLRIMPFLDITIVPGDRLDPAYEIYLVE